MKYVIGIDVGTTSTRAALFDLNGKKHAEAEKKIKIFEPSPHFVEQSSDDIWQSITIITQQIIAETQIDKYKITGIGFDATCSLVALNEKGKPASVSPSHEKNQNIILWMDHRAIEQVKQINATHSNVLSYVGGRISVEMEIPKILWLKQNEPHLYNNIRYFFDLSDFLTFRATGCFSRSSCTTTCKWTYLNHKESWNSDFFASIDLSDLLMENKIGNKITQIGECVGKLTSKAALELGLHEDVSVCSGMIDAHAGGIGVLGGDFHETLALITGTSACHMLCVEKETFVDAIWGPYFGAMLPHLWLLEGGQSTAGALVEHVIKESSQYDALLAHAHKENRSVYNILNERIYALEKDNPFLTHNYHILGYFLGNRSPLADPNLKGMITGLSLHDDHLDALAIRYLAALQAVAYGTRHIIEALTDKGCPVKKIRMCGGGTKNPLWLREHANITQIPIEIITETEAMLLGSAIVAAVSSGAYSNLKEAMMNMSKVKECIKPQTHFHDYHDKKYKVFRQMHQDFLNYRNIMKGER